MRVWFITGASRGFGALIAEAALKAGDAVVATARDPSTVTARLGNHEIVALLRDRVHLRPGETVRLKPNAQQAHMFDEASGARL